MTKVGFQIDVPPTYQSQLTVLATATPLAPEATKALSEEATLFKQVMGHRESLYNYPSQGTLTEAKTKLQQFAEMYNKAIEGVTSSYKALKKKDSVIIGLLPRVLFETKEAAELYKRKSALEAHKTQIAALLKHAEAQSSKLAKVKSTLANRELVLPERQEVNLGKMSYQQLKSTLAHFSKMHIEVAGVSQKSPSELFSALSRLFDLRLDPRQMAARVAFFDGKAETAPETVEGNVLDLHVLKFCTSAGYQHLMQQLNTVCLSYRTLDNKPFFIADYDDETARKYYIRKMDGAIEVRLEAPINLLHAGEAPFAKVNALLTVRIANDGKTTMKCTYNNVTPLAGATILDENRLSKVFYQEAKVSGVAKA